MEHPATDWLLAGAVQDSQSITKDWQLSSQPLIDGVQIKGVRPVLTGYGHLTEVYRTEWLTARPGVEQIFASTLKPGAVSAWHAHATTTDRLFVVAGRIKVVIYDARRDSPSYGQLNEFRLGVQRPMLIIVPPKLWHGVQNDGDETAVLLNVVDHAYRYEAPDHWRLAADSGTVPYRFAAG